MNTLMHIPTPLQPNTDYVVTNQSGWLVGAVFTNGTLGPLSLFRPTTNQHQLEYVRPLSGTEINTLARQPIMSWYVLTHSGDVTIALLHCRHDPHHQADWVSFVQGTGHVGV